MVQFAQVWWLPLPLLAGILAVWVSLAQPRKIRILRFLIALFVCLPITKPTITTESAPDIVFLLDISESIQYVSQKKQVHLLDYYTQTIHQVQQQRQAKKIGIVAFAENAKIIKPLSSNSHFELFIPTVNTQKSRLQSAVQLASNMLQQSPSKQIYLLSDGQFEDVLKTPLNKLPIEYIPNTISQNIDDASIQAMELPLQAAAGDYVVGKISIFTSLPGQIAMRFFSNGKIFHQKSFVAPQKGIFDFHFGVKIEDTNKQTIMAEIQSLEYEDFCPINNSYSCIVSVPPQRKKVLCIGDVHIATSHFNIVHPKTSEITPAEIAQGNYAVVIIADNALSLNHLQTAIQEYVANGGSVMMLGNNRTFAAGGYGRTPIEEVLPVWCVPQQEGLFVWAIVLDRSGSMNRLWSNQPKMVAAKRAISEVFGKLGQQDIVSLWSFHQDFQKNLDFAPAHQHDVQKALESIQASGKTRIFPVLQEVTKEIQKWQSQRKHVLLISDGESIAETQMLLKQAEEISQQGISLSVISTGDSGKLLQQMAKLAKGHYYIANSLQNLQGMIWQDFQGMKSSFIYSQPSTIVSKHTNFQEFDNFSLEKYAVTRYKNWAEPILESNHNHPIIARGYYKLGRSLAMTTNVSGWSKNLQNQALLFEKCLAWLSAENTFKIAINSKSNILKVYTDNDSQSELFAVIGDVVIGLQATAPQYYEAKLPDLDKGLYSIVVRDHISSTNIEYINPFKREYLLLGNAKLHFGNTEKSTHQNTVEFDVYFILLVIILFLIERILH